MEAIQTPDADTNPDIEALLAAFDPQIYDSQKGFLTLKLFTAVLTDADDKIVVDVAGITRWDATAGDVFWFVLFANSGQLSVVMNVANDQQTVGNELEVDIGGQKLSAVTPCTDDLDTFVPINMGSVNIENAGKVKVVLRIKSAKGDRAGRVQSLELHGPAAVGSKEEQIPREVTSTVLQMKEETEYDMIYNSITPVTSYTGTIFGVCGFEGDSAMTSLNDKDFEGDRCIAFNNTKFYYPWKDNETYHFLVKVARDSKDNSVVISSYVYLNEEAKWKLIGSQGVEKDDEAVTTLRSPYVQVYQSWGLQQGFFPREAYFGPMWAKICGGEWEELSTAQFIIFKSHISNATATVEDCRFFVSTGGYEKQQTGKNHLVAKMTNKLPEMLLDIESKLPE